MLPPVFVEPRNVSAPSLLRVRSDEVEGSKETEVLAKRSKPANEPASPTVPMRSKSTRGRLAIARAGKRNRRRSGFRRVIARVRA